MGRKRKPLIEKSTPIILRIDNKTLCELCKKQEIEFDENGEVFSETTISYIKIEIIKIIEEFVKK